MVNGMLNCASLMVRGAYFGSPCSLSPGELHVVIAGADLDAFDGGRVDAMPMQQRQRRIDGVMRGLAGGVGFDADRTAFELLAETGQQRFRMVLAAEVQRIEAGAAQQRCPGAAMTAAGKLHRNNAGARAHAGVQPHVPGSIAGREHVSRAMRISRAHGIQQCVGVEAVQAADRRRDTERRYGGAFPSQAACVAGSKPEADQDIAANRDRRDQIPPADRPGQMLNDRKRRGHDCDVDVASVPASGPWRAFVHVIQLAAPRHDRIGKGCLTGWHFIAEQPERAVRRSAVLARHRRDDLAKLGGTSRKACTGSVDDGLLDGRYHLLRKILIANAKRMLCQGDDRVRRRHGLVLRL